VLATLRTRPWLPSERPFGASFTAPSGLNFHRPGGGGEKVAREREPRRGGEKEAREREPRRGGQKVAREREPRRGGEKVAEREPRRGGQKVARGKREARSPWITLNKDLRPEGPIEIAPKARQRIARAKNRSARFCRPFGAGRLRGMIQGQRARYASHSPLDHIK
jgi:hypothetical protein